MNRWTFKIWCALCFGLLVGLLASATAGSTCDEPDRFACRRDPAICIPLLRVRDGTKDCPDGSDEECNSEEFQCTAIHQCIPKERLHDGWPDCDDGSDEECSSDEFRCRCGVPHCIDRQKVNDGHKDCDDGSDEESHQNSTLPCPDEGRLQDLMAVEKRRRKRQIDPTPSTFAPSVVQENQRKPGNGHRLFDRLLPSIGTNSNDRRSEVSKSTDEMTFLKISTETELYGSLNSGKIYQTAVKELTSSSVPKYTVPPSGKGENKRDEFMDEKISEHPSMKLSQAKKFSTGRAKKILLKSYALKKTDNANLSGYSNRHVMNHDDNSYVPSKNHDSQSYAKRHLLSIDSIKTPIKDIPDQGPEHEVYRFKRAEVESVLLTTSANGDRPPLKSLPPTGIVTSMTGTDIVDGKTTLWTTLIEGTFIKGTYAHIVRSTSRIFFTVTKTISPTMSSTIQMPTSTEVPSTPTAGRSKIMSSFDDISASGESSVKTMEESTESSKVSDTGISMSESEDEIETVNSDRSADMNAQTLTSKATKVQNHDTEKFRGMTSGPDTVDKIKNTISMQEPSSAISESSMISDAALVSSFSSYSSQASGIEDTSENLSTVADSDQILSSTIFKTAVLDSETSLLQPEETPKEVIEMTSISSHARPDAVRDEKILVDTTLKSPAEMTSNMRGLDAETNAGISITSVDLGLALTDDFESKSTSNIDGMPLKSQLELKTKQTSPLETISLILPTPTTLSRVTKNDEVGTESVEENLKLNTADEATEDDIRNHSTDSSKNSEVVWISSANNEEMKLLNNPSDIFTVSSQMNSETSTLTETNSPISPMDLPSSGSSMSTASSTSISTTGNSVPDLTTLRPSIEPFENDNPSSVIEIITNTPSIQPTLNEPVVSNEENSSTLKATDDGTDHKRVKRVVNEQVTVLRPDGRVVTVHPDVLLTPTTHYTTYTYYTTILKPGGGTSVQSRLHVDSDVAYPGNTHDLGIHTGIRHTIIDDDQPCCIRTVYEDTRDGYVTIPAGDYRPSAVTHTTTFTYYTTRFRDGTPHVETRKVTETNVTPIPTHRPGSTVIRPVNRETHYHTTTRPFDTVRPVTHRTTYTYYTTRFIGGTPVVDTRYETETNITPLNGHDVYDLTRRQQTAVRFGNPAYRPSYYRPDEHIHTEDPYVYSVHTHRINPSLYRPSSLTHRTTYTYHTTRFRDGTPIVDTRKVTETNVTPIPTHGPRRPAATRRPHVTTIVTTQYITRTVPVDSYPTAVVPHYHPRDEPYITHTTTYTYYTTKFRGGNSHVETRKETRTSVVPNPTYGINVGTRYVNGDSVYDSNYDPCPVCDHGEPEYPRVAIPVDYDDIAPRHPTESQRIIPTTTTHFSTYTYATTTLLPSGGRPLVRTREHTVTEVLPGVVLPTRADTAASGRAYTFGERIRTRRSVSNYLRDTQSETTPDEDDGNEMFNDLNPVKLTTIVEIKPTRRRGPRDTRETTRHPSRDRSDYARRINTFAPNTVSYAPQEIRPTTITYYSTYTYFTTELKNGVPVVKTREHTVTEILSDVIVPTVTRVNRPRPASVVRGPRQIRQASDASEQSSQHGEDGLATIRLKKNKGVVGFRDNPRESKDKLLIPSDVKEKQKMHGVTKKAAMRKLLSLEDGFDTIGFDRNLHDLISDSFLTNDEEGMALQPSESRQSINPKIGAVDLLVQAAENRPIVATPLTHYTTNTYYTTLLKPGGITSVKTKTEVVSSTYYPGRVRTENSDQNPRRRKIRRKKIIRKRVRGGGRPCEHCTGSDHDIARKAFASLTPSVIGPGYGSIPLSHHDVFLPQDHYGGRRASYLTSIPIPRHAEHFKPSAYIARNTDVQYAPDIKPTHVTYYSTYTYFTTELMNGRPVVKSREHTVTELLTDVVVPTVAPLGSQHAQNRQHRSGRGKRDADVDHNQSELIHTNVTSINSNQTEVFSLVSNSGIPGSVLKTSKASKISPTPTWSRHPSHSTMVAAREEVSGILPSYDEPPTVFLETLRPSERKYEGLVVITGEKGDASVSNFQTPPLYTIIEGPTSGFQGSPKSTGVLWTHQLLTGDLQAQGAEIRRAVVSKPLTYYTTHTYFTTVLKPGGSKVVETNTRVTSSVYHPIHIPVSARDDYHRNERVHDLRQKNFKKEHVITGEKCKKCEEQKVGVPYRPTFAPARHPHAHHYPDDHKKTCPSCQVVDVSSRNRQHDSYRRRLPLLTSVSVPRARNTGRAFPQRAPNTIEYPEDHVKPTRVTFYSTYTYFTTELKDGRPSVRSREHTVTEILTDVIVPTVAPMRGKRDAEIMQTQAAFEEYNHQSSDIVVEKPAVMRKLLSVSKEDEGDDELEFSKHTSELSTEGDLDLMDSPDDNLLEGYLEMRSSEIPPDAVITKPITLTADFFDSDQVTKAFNSYLELLEPSKAQVKPETDEELTEEGFSGKNNAETDDNITKPVKLELVEKMPVDITSDIKVVNRKESLQPDTTTTVTSEVTKNGRITRYLKTIYGTYINGIHAQKATSKSEIIPLTKLATMNNVEMSPAYSPSRSLGLVSIKVSKTTRGPVAVHFTTEIHGTFIAGAYAQTARVYTSYQRITTNSAKDGPKLRTYSTSSTQYSGPRKTGLLSSRVLKSRVEDGTTFLLVSEIHGTHIGGAYAHLGTYITRTIGPNPTSFPAVYSSDLPTYKMNEIETGLITVSVSDRVSDSTTTRFHYEVHGTFLDGTYAHVPVARTEVILPSSLVLEAPASTKPDDVGITQKEKETNENAVTGRSLHASDSSARIEYDRPDGLKIGLIEASTRINVNNGITTRRIFEVHGTYLGDMYAHVPKISVETITPSKTASYESLTSDLNFSIDTEEQSEANIDTVTPEEPKMGLIDSSVEEKVSNGSTTLYVHKIYGTYLSGTYAHVPSIEIETITTVDELGYSASYISENPTEQSSRNFASLVKLLPEELRISFHGNSDDEHRAKRYVAPSSEFSPLQSSFSESIKGFAENIEEVKTATVPLSNSMILEKSLFSDTVDIASKVEKDIRETQKTNPVKLKFQKDKEKSKYINSPEKKLIRSKRSSSFTRTPYGRPKAQTTPRKFGSSSTEKRGATRKFQSSTRSSSYKPYAPVTPTKSVTKEFLLPKRSRLFPLRGRNSQVSEVTDSSQETLITTSPDNQRTSGRRFKKFGPQTARAASIDEDFDASEAVVMSVTDQQIPSTTRRPRPRAFTRPAKLPKFAPRSTVSVNRKPSSSSVPSVTPSKKHRLHSPSLRAPRKPSRFGRKEEVTSAPAENYETETSRKRFTLTTSFSINVKPTASISSDVDDSSEENNVLRDRNRNSKRRSKGFTRGRSRLKAENDQSSFDDDNNEVMENKPRTLPLPPFGRSRGFKRPSTFDPRTLKESTPTTSSTITYITNVPPSPVAFQEEEFTDEDGVIERTVTPKLPVTVTDIVTTVKTLAVHHGLRTSYATITTTAYSTSTIKPDDLTVVSKDGRVRTIVSTKISTPSIDLHGEKQNTLVTEYFITTTEIDSTSLLAIKVNYATRTDTVVARHILTTLTSQISTVREPQHTTPPGYLQYPYFQNPFLPPHVPNPSIDFALPTQEESIVTTETLTSTTVLPLLLNGKTLLTTLTSTSVTESTLLQTPALQAPQNPAIPPPFVFPQPVFILPSITTQITVHFTGQNGELFAVVTTVTVPLMQNPGHTRLVRSAEMPSMSTIESTSVISEDCTKESNDQSVDSFKKEDPLRINNGCTHANDDTKTFQKPKSTKKQIEQAATFKKRKLLQLDTEEGVTDGSISDEKWLPISENEAEPVSSARSGEAGTYNSQPGYNEYVTNPFFLSGPGYFDDSFSRPIPPVRVVPTRRAYVRRIRPGNVPQPIPEEPFALNYPSETFGIRQTAPQFYPQRFNSNPLGSVPRPFIPNYAEEGLSFGEQPLRPPPQRRPEFVENNIPPQGRRVIRLRRPGNIPNPQPELMERKPIVNTLPEDYAPLRARGPVVDTNTAPVQDARRPVTEPNTIPNRPVPPIPVPLTYYTTFTYMTTFLNGPSTAYSTREAVVSNVATEALNPSIIELIRSRGGFSTAQGAPTAVPLGTRAHGPTTTVVNLASRVQVFNSDIYYSRPDLPPPPQRQPPPPPPKTSELQRVSLTREKNDESSVINTLPISEVASLPKTYYTLFTYYYTLNDGDRSSHSQRSEVISKVATDAEPFIKQKFTNTIDGSGDITLSPEKEVINLGSRAVGGTTTEVNLELRTIVHFDNLRNVVIDRNGIAPSLVEIKPTVTDEPTNNYLEPGDAEVQDQNTYPQTVPIQPSFSSSTQLPENVGSRNDGATPEIPQDLQVVRTRPFRGPVRVTSVQRPGSLRSGVFAPRPGVRVRVRPVTSRAEGPSLSSSFEHDLTAKLTPSESSFEVTRDASSTPDEGTATTSDEEVEGYDSDEEGDEENEDLRIEDNESTEVEDEEEKEEGTTEEPKDSIASNGRRRLKITIRRPTGSGITRGERPSRTRPRFYVVTRTGSPGSVRRGSLRPVSVKVTRRPKVSETPRYETYTTVTSVPVIFGLSTTYRNAIVTSSFLVPSSVPEVSSPVAPSKTLVLTYFTTTTYTVPFTVSGETSFTTFEETNSRVVTETVAQDADLSFVSTTVLDEEPRSSIMPKPAPTERLMLPKTLLPVQIFNNAQTLANQLNVGQRQNLVTKVSNGVTLIIASDADSGSTPTTGTLQPTTLTDALLMMDKGYTTVYEPRTFYTTFTFFTTFFKDGAPSISTSEQVVTNVYTIPVTQPIGSATTRTSGVRPTTVVDTSEQLVSTTLYSTHTVYATLFNDTETIVIPIEELQSSVVTSTETFTITKTLLSPQPEAPPLTISPEIRSSDIQPSLTTTETTLYKTLTNFVTLFRGTESVVSPLEEVVTEVATLTLQPSMLQPSTTELMYTTRTIQTTTTHYVTLFSGGQAVLSSITEVVPTVVTEVANQIRPTAVESIYTISTTSSELSFESEEVSPTTRTEEASPTYQDLVPSVKTQYTTLTYFTTLYKDSSTILSSREEIATSYITLFVPVPAVGLTSAASTSSFDSSIERSSDVRGDRSSSIVLEPSDTVRVSPTTEVLTFYTTYTYYTTLFRGTETIISDSETVVTQYVTIETTPSDGMRRTTSGVGESVRPSISETADVRIEHTVSAATTDLGTDDKMSPTRSTFDILTTTARNKAVDSITPEISYKMNIETITPSVLVGTPTTDANGATHILFTDFIVPESPAAAEPSDDTPFAVTPSLPDLAVSSGGFKPPSTTERFITTILESSDGSQTRATASDQATTRVTDANIATLMPVHPTSPYQILPGGGGAGGGGATQTFGIKPGAVIDLSDVLGNTNLVGNLGETIKDIVNLFAAGNKNKNTSAITDPKVIGDGSNVDSAGLPVGGVPVSNAEEPVYIPIGAIGRGSQRPSSSIQRPGGALQPSTLLSGFTPVQRGSQDKTAGKVDEYLRAQEGKITNVRTSLVIGSDTIFIEPTSVMAPEESTELKSMIGSDGSTYIISEGDLMSRSPGSSFDGDIASTPVIVTSDSTSIITGIETIFFGLPDARLPVPGSDESSKFSGKESNVNVETIFFDTESKSPAGAGNSQITGETTIFGSFPVMFGSDSTASSSSTPTSFTKTTSGATTIFFPVDGDDSKSRQSTSPGTKYVTSVQSTTLTLTLTTSSVYQSDDTPVTVTSVFTTTIPPRTFISTIIGSRTILGTQPEPTEAVQVIPTIQPSESTTTVTTTTLIFNSIATTVVRTLVIPTKALKPTETSTETLSTMDGQQQPGDNTGKSATAKPTPGRKPIQLFKSANRPTTPPPVKPANVGPPLKLFPTRPSTTTTNPPPPKEVTTRKTTFRKPGKALVPVTDGCPRECNLKNKEVCKQNADRSWSCQCRPGFFKKDSDECIDVKSYTVLLRVLQMGGNEISYNPELDDTRSPVYKNLTTTARKAVDDAYKQSAVGDNYVSTNVLGISNTGRSREGVLVNLTVTVRGDKPTTELELKDELMQSLEAAASEAISTNATIVSPIIQRVEDVQDFDECAHDNYNDCSRSAHCVNLPGTYTCECKEGYQDLEPLLPGRICSGEIKDCDYCNNRGVCIMTEDDEKFCRCYRMYLGKQCEINGLVLAIALPIALALLILTVFCLLCGCRRLRRRRAQKPKQNVFKNMAPPLAGTLDRKAMIIDSSSESSAEQHAKANHGYDGFGDDVNGSTFRREGRRSRSNSIEDRISDDFGVPTVVIPRARHQHPNKVNHPSHHNFQRTRTPYDDHW